MKRLATITTLLLWLSMALTSVANAATGTIEKDCTGIRFFGTVAEGEMVRLEVRLHNTADWQSPVIQDEYILVPAGPYDVFVPWVDFPEGKLNRAAISVSTNGGSTWTGLALNEDFIECAPPGGEGCTPGYWKNHLEDWPATGYSPGDDFDTTFGVDLFSPDITLEAAVNAKGGGVKKLARHGTAALLSAAHPDVGYPFTEAEVIALVQAGDVDPLVAANELGCEIP
ncbi:MAG: hypothetical protein OEY45_11480 [Gammaproteobacteria bacterium]|nr:hypothetical protein [Gammaproteobacteria bacterium]